MLFNTLEYAWFLALVFAITWLLVDRRLSLLLPWFALLSLAVTGSLSALSGESAAPLPSFLAVWGVVAAGFMLSLGLIRRVAPGEPPRPALTWIQLSAQLGALTYITTKSSGLDPFSWGLAQLHVPVRALGPGSWIVGALGVGLSYLLLRAQKVRLLFILLSSYVFYAHWDYRFLPLIWGSSTADWWLAKRIANSSDPTRRKMWLLGTVILNLGVLGFFKYFNFGIDSMKVALSAIGVAPPEVVLRIALPVGISFFTFESMSYVIDVYRKELPPHESYAEYLSFVAFFPHLVAGPIVRPRDLLPQLAAPGRFRAAEASEGLFLIAVGLGKKIVVGDYLALNLIDRVFDAPAMYSALETYAAVVAYALQIYCDFSGYTDIAIGSALLLGIRFPLNFDSPYKAHNIVDFWRRWHISLSTWLRDYLYIPLGGNRKGHGRTYLNLMITMVLGGLWHGAAWTFVVWGFLHGAALALNKWFQETMKAPRLENRARAAGPFPPSDPPPQSGRWWLGRVLSVLLTVHFVCACWIFFRAESFQKAQLVFSRLATLSTHHPNLPPSIVGVIALGILGHYVPDKWFDAFKRAFIYAPWPAQGLALSCAAWVLRRMASTDAVPFVYFQF